MINCFGSGDDEVGWGEIWMLTLGHLLLWNFMSCLRAAMGRNLRSAAVRAAEHVALAL